MQVRLQVLADVIHEVVDPQAEIINIRYIMASSLTIAVVRTLTIVQRRTVSLQWN